MTTINSFAELEQAMDEADYDFYSLNLTDENKEALRIEALNFSDEQIQETERILKKYYSTKVPKELLKKLLSQDILLAFEAYTQGIGDTSQRGLLMDAVLDYLEMRPWPINGEGDDIFIEFCRELKDKASHHSITFPVEE
jgi:hypothetical protein